MLVPFIDVTEIQFKFQKEKGNTKYRICKAIEMSWKGYRKKNKPLENNNTRTEHADVTTAPKFANAIWCFNHSQAPT